MIETKVATLWDAGAAQYDAGTKRNQYFNFLTNWIAEHASDLQALSECSVLDMGCGTGLNIALLSGVRSRIRAEGVDFSPGMIEAARATGLYERLHTHDLNKPIPDIESGSFDLAIAFGFLEFLTDAHACLSECARCLKPDGVLWATFQRFEAGDAGSPPREVTVGSLQIRGYSAGEILHMTNDIGLRLIGLDIRVGYLTQNGFACSYYVLRAKNVNARN